MVGYFEVADLSKVRVINSPESGKVVWITNNNSICVIRLRDNKKKVFQSYWTVNEENPSAKITPIGVEFVNKTNLILGLVMDHESNYFWLSMNFKEKKKKIIAAKTLTKDGRHYLRSQRHRLFLFFSLWRLRHCGLEPRPAQGRQRRRIEHLPNGTRVPGRRHPDPETPHQLTRQELWDALPPEESPGHEFTVCVRLPVDVHMSNQGRLPQLHSLGFLLCETDSF